MLPYSTTFQRRMLYMCIVLTMCTYVNVPVHAQNMDNFTGLVSEGKIPKQITTSSAQKYEVLKTDVSVEDLGRRKKKQINKFNMEGTFGIDQMMRNGFVLFNDPVSEYINQVADRLLENDPNMRSNINFYAIRSSRMNAFATDRGDIFINIGLLTYLETEAQLAFILAHEITHWKEKHSMDTFLEYEGIEQSNRGYRKKNDFDKLLEKSNYSKKIEEEADSDGLELFLKSPYGTGSLEKMFDMMAVAHAPYIDEPFDVSYLNTKGFTLSDSLLLKKVNKIKPYEDDEEELSTHPGVESRKASLRAALAKAKASENKEDFLIGEQKFEKIRELAKFEVCKISLERYSYPEALYYSAVLNKKYPNNTFLESIKLKSLYGLAKIVSIPDEVGISGSDTIQGQLQQVYYLFEKFSDIEVVSLAASHLWEYCEAHPEDEGMQLRLADLMIHLGEENKEIIKTLTGKQQDKFVETAGIFKEQAENTRFKNMLNTKRQKTKEPTNKDLRKGFRLGAKKVMFINPQYISINLRKPKAPIQFVEAENKQEEMVKMIKENARRLGMTAKIMDVQSLKKNADASKFNDITTMERWIEQKILLPDGMIPNNHNEATKIMEKNKVKHIAFMGGLGLKEKMSTQQGNGTGALGIFMIVSIPVGIYNLIKPNNKSMFYTIVIDADKQDTVMTSYNIMNQKDGIGAMNSNVYWMLHQMKSKPKK